MILFYHRANLSDVMIQKIVTFEYQNTIHTNTCYVIMRANRLEFFHNDISSYKLFDNYQDFQKHPVPLL